MKIASEPVALLYFFDASALVKRYVDEADSDRVDELLREAIPAVCRTSEVEVASALCRRAREGVFSHAERDRAVLALRRDISSFQVVEVLPEVVERSLVLLARHPLRAADALQLGACLILWEKLRFPVAFVAFDARLREAAAAEGLAVLPPR